MSVALGFPRLRPELDRSCADMSDRPRIPGLVDRFGRTATDLRISLTDRCNLRCTYCMPAEGLPTLQREQTMDRSEIVRLAQIGVERLGIRSIRLTGGEPLLRHDLVEIVAALSALDPRPEIALTTNGVGMASRAAALVAAGLDRVNVSLDSLDEETFSALSRRPFLPRVLAGIDALETAGIGGIKINSVLVPGVNDAEAPRLVEWALSRGFELRFIEQMPLGAERSWTRADVVTAAQTQRLLRRSFALSPAEEPREGAPAERWTVRRSEGGPVLGTLGIIASVTEPFCADCTRTRLTADGAVRPCLFAQHDVPLLDLVRVGADDETIADAWRAAMWRKQPGHGMALPGFAQPARTMSAIGG